jgi:serine/threonine protein kinase
MGVIYGATDPLIGRPVAIKTIRLSCLDSGTNREELTRRLYREAQSAGILSHPGIITIHDIGEQGEDAYIVMEFVTGKSLEEVLSSDIPQHSESYISILKQSAIALDYAHSKGIIHRDIKPSNIMICEDGQVKIADFGVAKLTASASMTQSGLVLGTPSYMSPEQAQGLGVDGRSDQFSLAVVAYRILTGRLPFVASTLTALLAKILWEEPDYESAGLHPPLLAVFTKALSKDPHLRFANCTEFIGELEAAFAESKKIPAQAIRNAAAGTEYAPRHAPGKNSFRKRAWIAGIATLALIAIGVFATINFQKRREPLSSQNSNAVLVTPLAKTVPAMPEQTSRPAGTVSPPAQPVETKPIKAMVPPPKAVLRDPADLPRASTSNRQQKSAEKRENSPVLTSGTIVWSGELPKNAVLVIDEQQVSIGSITGSLPGKPVQIEVTPKDIKVRQAPDPANAWKLIILYSGNQKYSSITINWRVIS